MPSQLVKILNESYEAVENDGEDVMAELTRNPNCLPPKHFYDARGSELFEKICELPEYYPTRTDTSIFKECADEIAQITDSYQLIELDGDSSTKTRLLLDAYQKIGDSFTEKFWFKASPFQGIINKNFHD